MKNVFQNSFQQNFGYNKMIVVRKVTTLTKRCVKLLFCN